MKSCVLTACLLLLVVATAGLWNRRFEVRAGVPVLRVGDAPGGGFAVDKARGEKPVARVYELPFGEPVEALRVRYSGRAVDLVKDGEEWRDGRLILEWRDAVGQVKARDTVATFQGDDRAVFGAEVIVRSAGSGLVPALRVEHLGLSGRMEVRFLEFVAVRGRAWATWAAGALIISWGLWCYGFVRALTRVPWPRVAGVAAMLVVMGWVLVVPGPWPHARSLAGTFDIGGDPAASRVVEISGVPGSGQDVEPLMELRYQGGWVLQVKKTLFFLRPVLHAVLFAVPALIIAFACGVRCAWWCGVLASCAVEFGQLGFGFGFDWVDGMDLLVDVAGVAAGLWVWKRWGKVFGKW